MQIRNSLVCNGLKLTKLETRADFESKEIGSFDCGFEDLNDFFKNDAYENKKMLFSETYSVHLDQPDTPEIVALISFSNDCVTKNKTVAKHLKNKDIPHSTMRYKSYPAVKITRFGVKKKYQGQDLGTYILNMVKEMFLSDNRTGCRFITVDAYIKSTGFYQKNEFEFYHSSDDDKNTRIMFFDLIKYEKALEQKCTHSHS